MGKELLDPMDVQDRLLRRSRDGVLCGHRFVSSSPFRRAISARSSRSSRRMSVRRLNTAEFLAHCTSGVAGEPGDPSPGGDVAGDARLRRDRGAVADGDVADDAGLAPADDAHAELGRAGDADLRPGSSAGRPRRCGQSARGCRSCRRGRSGSPRARRGRRRCWRRARRRPRRPRCRPAGPCGGAGRAPRPAVEGEAEAVGADDAAGLQDDAVAEHAAARARPRSRGGGSRRRR